MVVDEKQSFAADALILVIRTSLGLLANAVWGFFLLMLLVLLLLCLMGIGGLIDQNPGLFAGVGRAAVSLYPPLASSSLHLSSGNAEQTNAALLFVGVLCWIAGAAGKAVHSALFHKPMEEDEKKRLAYLAVGGTAAFAFLSIAASAAANHTGDFATLIAVFALLVGILAGAAVAAFHAHFLLQGLEAGFEAFIAKARQGPPRKRFSLREAEERLKLLEKAMQGPPPRRPQ